MCPPWRGYACAGRSPVLSTNARTGCDVVDDSKSWPVGHHSGPVLAGVEAIAYASFALTAPAIRGTLKRPATGGGVRRWPLEFCPVGRTKGTCV